VPPNPRGRRGPWALVLLDLQQQVLDGVGRRRHLKRQRTVGVDDARYLDHVVVLEQGEVAAVRHIQRQHGAAVEVDRPHHRERDAVVAGERGGRRRCQPLARAGLELHVAGVALRQVGTVDGHGVGRAVRQRLEQVRVEPRQHGAAALTRRLH
jgi:hypothetical protein